MEDDDEEFVQVITCQGPPICMLQKDEAVAAAIAGCMFCVRQNFIDGQPVGMTCPGNA